jgi:hypothetical protein
MELHPFPQGGKGNKIYQQEIESVNENIKN